MKLLLGLVCERATSFRPRHRVRRLRVFYALSSIWIILLICRLFSLQVSDVERWREWALRQHIKVITYAAERAPILDRWNRPLAKSIPVESLYAHPGKVKDLQAVASTLSAILGQSSQELLDRLRGKAAFVWLARHLPRVQAQKIQDLNLPGIGVVSESRRAYPYKGAAGVLLGRVGLDGEGLSGLELVYDDRLKGSQVRAPAMRDGHGNYLSTLTEESLSTQALSSKPLQLTIDAEIQAILTSELVHGVEINKAASAFGLMIDSQTGEILALSQAPALNLNEGKIGSRQALRNLVVENVFEPGSVMKPLVAAVALEEGVVRSDEMFDCENGRLRFGGHTIRDTHPIKLASFREVVVRSSNIGMAKVAERLGAEGVYEALRKFGFGERTGLGLPGETAGILRPVKNWAEIDIATHSFGQGVAVTAPQVVRAMAAIANGGTLVPLKLVQGEKVAPTQRILSEFTASQVQSMLRGVVEEEHGTGNKAAIPGVIIGGKTGTAQKARVDGRGYANGKYIASFLGYVDGSSVGVPRVLTLIIVVDEPAGGSIYGGSVAAPIFRRVVKKSLRYLSTRNELKAPELDGFVRAVWRSA